MQCRTYKEQDNEPILSLKIVLIIVALHKYAEILRVQATGGEDLRKYN